MNITQNLQKWGNSTGIRIPAKVMSAAKVKPNQTMTISLMGGSIVLTPLEDVEGITLDTMLMGVTPENAHSEFPWGEDVGAEKIHD
jgi:antitoxin MazE